MYAVKRSKLTGSFSMVMLGVFLCVALATPFLPDYETYRAIYDNDGGHLAAFGRDMGFVFVVQLLSPILNYENFRWLILLIIAIMTIYSFRKFQMLSRKRLGITFVMALTPIVLMKFGAQIREGIALLIWLTVVFTSNRPPCLVLFVSFALVSGSIHLAVVPLWILLGFSYYLLRWPALRMVLGVAIYAGFTYLVADVSRLTEEFFSGLSQAAVTPDFLTVLYWLFYPAIFIFSVTRGDTVIQSSVDGETPLVVLGFVLHAAMIGFLIGLSLQIAWIGRGFFLKGAISDVMRVAALLLSLYCLFLAARGQKRYATALAVLLIVDTIRIILAA